jgi:uncharacterized protein YbaP (TraB family)
MRILLALLACLGFCSCAQKITVSPVPGATYESIWGHSRPSSAPAPQTIAPLPVATHGGPALWSVTHAGATVYLFGTMHVPMGNTPWLTPTIETALNNSGHVWTETDIDTDGPFARSFAKRAYDPHYDLSAAFPAASWATLSTALRQCRMDPNRARHMHAWAINFLAMMCARPASDPAQRAGATPANAIPDLYVVGAARARHIPLSYFEISSQHIAAFADVPDSVQMHVLMQLIDAITRTKAMTPAQLRQQADLAAMNRALEVRYWSQGDTAHLAVQINAMNAQPEGAAFYKTMLTVRNEHFADVIISLLHEQAVSFVAVGTGHFVSADGVIPILQAHGFDVVRLE